ncbi:MAG: phosphate acyltransferase PlsX [Lactobacillus sp.]|nr:phosphate acyltransferase PlsX [Lactobacillus sp.]
MKKIAIDAMGGENAPQAIVEAALQALPELGDKELLLFGDEKQLKALVPSDKLGNGIEIIPTTEVILDEDEPVKAIRTKKDASMVVAARYVKEGKADALLSLGNTGALLSCGIFIIGRMKGVARPGLMPTLPALNSSTGFNMLDVGANAQSKPEYLVKWAQMANAYVEKIKGIDHPRVALLNNGAEYDKGDDLHKESYQLLKETDLNFIGNIEGNELLQGKADIVVTDGFTGNASLKTLEGTTRTLLSLLKSSLLENGIIAKLGALMIKNALQDMRSKFDVDVYGGAVLLGLEHPVVKGHGNSKKRTIYYTIKQVSDILDKDLIANFKIALGEGENHD